MPWLAAVGAAAGGIGNAVSSFNQPGPLPELNPEIAAALQQQGIDISQFQAQNQANQFNATMPFNQAITQYGPQLQQALSQAYNQTYGGGEQAAAQFAQDTFSGKDNPVTQNQISALGQNVGQQRQQGTNALQSNFAQSGISPDSPLYQKMLQEQNLGSQAQFTGGASAIRTNQANNDFLRALQILQMGQQSNRLAGANLPQVPLTAQQAQQQYLGSQVPGLLQGTVGSSMAHDQPGGIQHFGGGFLNFGKALPGLVQNSGQGLVPSQVSHPGNYNVPNYNSSGQGVNYSSGGGGSGHSGPLGWADPGSEILGKIGGWLGF